MFQLGNAWTSSGPPSRSASNIVSWCRSQIKDRAVLPSLSRIKPATGSAFNKSFITSFGRLSRTAQCIASSPSILVIDANSGAANKILSMTCDGARKRQAWWSTVWRLWSVNDATSSGWNAIHDRSFFHWRKAIGSTCSLVSWPSDTFEHWFPSRSTCCSRNKRFCSW